MKSVLLSLTLLTSLSSFAGNRDINVDIDINPMRCNRELREVKKENDSLKDSLAQCLTSRDSRNDHEVRELKRRLEVSEVRLEQEIQKSNALQYHLNMKEETILDLQARIRTLEDQIYPDRNDGFNLAESLKECRGISNAAYATQCTTHVKQYSIKASGVKTCALIKNAYYAAECVKNIGQYNGNARQVRACIEIKNDAYALQCVTDAATGKIRPDVIASCVESSTNAYYQADCVKQMKN